MSDFSAIARILGAIRGCEGKPFNVSAVSPEALGTGDAVIEVMDSPKERGSIRWRKL